MVNLLEAPEDDARRSEWADDFLGSIVSYVHQRIDSKLHTGSINGHECPSIFASQMGVRGIFGDVLVGFFNYESDYAGKVTDLKTNVDGANYLMMIRVGYGYGEDELSVKNIYYALCQRDTRNTIRHEMQHILDLKRRKDKTGPLNTHKLSTNDDLDGYYNHPLEFNAFFHNIAEPLLERIRWAIKYQSRDPQQVMDILDLFGEHLPEDYRVWLAGRLSLLGRYREYWNHLTRENKHKVIVRLGKLFELYHTTYRKVKEEAVNQIAQQWREEDEALDQLDKYPESSEDI